MRTKLLILCFMLVLFNYFHSDAFASDHIAKGSVPGELYIQGAGGYYPLWVEWLYRSTDYGQTVTIQNTTELFGQLGEGVAIGELYKTYSDYIYYSDDFGETFLQKSFLADLIAIASGYAAGEVYAYKYNSMRYSTDYGETFNYKGTCPGQVRCMSVGHGAGEVYCGCFAGEVYRSDDYGETYELVADLPLSFILNITRGSEAGEIYLFGTDNKLYYSPNGGDSLYQQYYFDIEPDYLAGIAGGFLSGEIYVLESRFYPLGGGDLYIHRSTDYGQTFIARHLYSGNDDTVPPRSIDDLSCSACDSSLFLDWSPISKDIWNRTEQVDYYVVYRNTDPYFEPSSGDSIGFSTTSFYTDTGARWATQAIYYIVKAVDDAGNKSDDSNRVGKMNKLLVNE